MPSHDIIYHSNYIFYFCMGIVHDPHNTKERNDFMDGVNNMANIFQKGQVWFWADPEYLEKPKHLRVPADVAGTHYSRYVLIAQEPKTASPENILVVPLSSQNTTPYDVRVRVDHLYLSKYSFARCSHIFPVKPRVLTNYICMIDNETMQVVSGELLKIMFPEIISHFDLTDLKKYAGINLVNNTLNEYKEITSKLEQDCNAFIKAHVRLSINASDTISMQDMFAAYQRFCIMNSIQVCDDIVLFTNVFIATINKYVNKTIPSPRWYPESRIKEIVFSKMTLSNVSDRIIIEINNNDQKVINPTTPPEDVKVSESPEVQTMPNPEPPKNNSNLEDEEITFDELLQKISQLKKSKNGGVVWKEDAITLFRLSIDQFGVDQTSSAFRLTKMTTLKYMSMFKIKPGTSAPGISTSTKISNFHRKKNAKQIWEFIRYYNEMGAELTAKKYEMTRKSVYNAISRYHKEGYIIDDNSSPDQGKKDPNPDSEKKADSEKKDVPKRIHIKPQIVRGISLFSNIMREHLRMNNMFSIIPNRNVDAFEKQIGAAIYYTIFKVTGVHDDNGNVTTPVIMSDSPVKWFYDFLLNISNEDQFPFDIVNWGEFKAKYEMLYNGKIGAPAEIMSVLEEKLVRCRHTDPKGAKMIIECLKVFVVKE